MYVKKRERKKKKEKKIQVQNRQKNTQSNTSIYSNAFRGKKTENKKKSNKIVACESIYI